MSHAAFGLHRDSSATRTARSALRPSCGAATSLAGPFQDLAYTPHEDWAWANYKSVVLAFAEEIRRDRTARQGGAPRVRLLEIGGGRDPLFTQEEAGWHGLDITINDIDQAELDLAPPGYGHALFDVAGDLDPARVKLGAYDVIFSRMVFEHVVDVAKAWGNQHLLLAAGGVALAFHPTLYAPPFLINKLIPERLSARVLRLFFPDRHEGVQPKFPALYNWCYGDDQKVGRMLEAIGFRERLIAPFWSHGYFRSIPILREIDAAFQNLARRRNWRAFTTYAYTLARK